MRHAYSEWMNNSEIIPKIIPKTVRKVFTIMQLLVALDTSALLNSRRGNGSVLTAVGPPSGCLSAESPCECPAAPSAGRTIRSATAAAASAAGSAATPAGRRRTSRRRTSCLPVGNNVSDPVFAKLVRSMPSKVLQRRQRTRTNGGAGPQTLKMP